MINGIWDVLSRSELHGGRTVCGGRTTGDWRRGVRRLECGVADI